MKIRSVALALVAVAFIVTAVAAPALAMYHPGMGRFMQRDPHGTMNTPTAPRVGMAGPAAAGSFVARDPMPTQPQPSLQYADGMNLYQYLRSRPLYYTDSQGTSVTVWLEKGAWLPAPHSMIFVQMPWGANEFNQKTITVELPEQLSCLEDGDHWNGTSWIPDNSYHTVAVGKEYDQPDFQHPWDFHKGAIAQDQIMYHAWAVRYTGEIVESTVDYGCKVTEAVRRSDEEIEKEQDKLDERGANEKAWPWEWQTRNCKKCCIYKIRPKDMVIWTDRFRHQTLYDFARYKLRK